jgi:cytochrome c-type biogenesis protein CcmF
VCVTGVTMTSVYSVERDVRMQIGDTVQLGPYGFRLASLRAVDGPNYQATQATVEVLDSAGRVDTVLAPEKRLYNVQRMPMTEVAIQPGLTRDLYLALGEPLAEGVWAVRIHYKPFVRWIWLGAVLMALGGLLAVGDPRYRQSRRRSTNPITTGNTGVAQA